MSHYLVLNLPYFGYSKFKTLANMHRTSKWPGLPVLHWPHRKTYLFNPTGRKFESSLWRFHLLPHCLCGVLDQPGITCAENGPEADHLTQYSIRLQPLWLCFI